MGAARARVAETRGLLRQAGVRPAPGLEVDGATGRPVGSPGKEEYSAAYSHPIEIGGKRDKASTSRRKQWRWPRPKSRNGLCGWRPRSSSAPGSGHARAAAGFARPADGHAPGVSEAHRSARRAGRRRAAGEPASAGGGQPNQAKRRTAEGARQVALTDLRRLCGWLGRTAGAGPRGTARLPGRRRHRSTAAAGAGATTRPARRQTGGGAGCRRSRLTEAQGRPDVTFSAQYALRNEQDRGSVRVHRVGPAGTVARPGQHSQLRSVNPSPHAAKEPRQH